MSMEFIAAWPVVCDYWQYSVSKVLVCVNNSAQGALILMKLHRKSTDLEMPTLAHVYKWARECGSCMVSSTCVALEKHCWNISQ